MHALHKHAFTLIELLIVVAIIAILAAIAVPNFLEAQTRAKVSRAKADMRTMAVAIESYRVDSNHYPLCADEDGTVLGARGAAAALPDFAETRISHVITTPVAYITSLFDEPFPKQGDPENPQYHYSTRAYLLFAASGSDADWITYMNLVDMPTATSLYYTLSHGPDCDHDDIGEGNPARYDPTNGTVSNGDLLYVGPGIGFGK